MIKFVPFENGNVFGMKAFDGETEAGFCTFTLDGYFMNFENVECADDILKEGLARAAMNFAANRNAYISKLPSEFSSPAFVRLGFEGDGVMSVEIPEALALGCTCGHSNPF